MAGLACGSRPSGGTSPLVPPLSFVCAAPEGALESESRRGKTLLAQVCFVQAHPSLITHFSGTGSCFADLWSKPLSELQEVKSLIVKSLTDSPLSWHSRRSELEGKM